LKSYPPRRKTHAEGGQEGTLRFDLARRLVAEALGTCFLVRGIVGSGIMVEELAGGNGALALLGNSLPVGAVLFVIITLFEPISGAHFNPAVSLIATLRGDLDRRTALAYVIVQIMAGCLGAVLANVMFDLSPLQIAQNARSEFQGCFAEFVATFGLLGTILVCARFRPKAMAMTVALYITSAQWFTSSTSFANPAVTIARMLSNTYAGIAPVHVLPFIVAEILGALAATALFGWLLKGTLTASEEAASPRAEATEQTSFPLKRLP
jgi:glycerol uptake facilitator-like aquaporin